jgi:hypothetical protein
MFVIAFLLTTAIRSETPSYIGDLGHFIFFCLAVIEVTLYIIAIITKVLNGRSNKKS